VGNSLCSYLLKIPITLANRTFLTENNQGAQMKGSELLRKIKKPGKIKNIPVELVHRRGKGSHSTLFYGNQFTIIRNLSDELKTGTYHAILKQLNINEKELG
jgi:mRNA interferase HicA